MFGVEREGFGGGDASFREGDMVRLCLVALHRQHGPPSLSGKCLLEGRKTA